MSTVSTMSTMSTVSTMGARSGQKPAHSRSRLIFHELQCHTVHAVTQTCRTRPVIEHVPEVAVTARTGDFRARHSQTPILGFDHVFLLEGRPETWPAGT